ncbi:KUP/HAK/KT family potassium transporter [Acetobacteraceae bacterium KSS8]|uniref:Probable potassium transport system protein Kup n=1 Tax=Endosaccharibacter trunci TaxID=2812733 RepID=A0ABT1WAX7_9PROT|nr:KUP/HAK/KT family potassium transporter [Acetobacteraceae bacterium KSS8]
MAQDNQRGVVVSALAALGIVYGDLGTSPLYTFQTVVGDAGGTITREIALGSLSLIVWALIVVITFKYCVVVMRADNQGEGGILALMSLLKPPSRPGLMHGSGLLIAAGLFGAALIYGDGIITPAISVLGALEGLDVATSAFKPFILPIAVAILVILFAAQPLGTAKLGRAFGPVMLVWFAVIAAMGAVAIARSPGVLQALDPLLGLRFLLHHGFGSFTVLGGVFLALTGGEALYADMGHLGRRPVRLSWGTIVLPALLLNYAGQAAQIVRDPSLAKNSFFSEVPHWGVYPLVILATIATIIASQAIITGAFSLTRQAMQLGWMPGLIIHQTSDEEYGQIYVPLVNWTMMIATIAITVGFGSSARLAGAFGTAVSTTMLLTTILLADVMRNRWRWGWPAILSVVGILLVIDIAFFAANLLKILDGGFVPLLFGLALFVIMITWHEGVARMRASLKATAPDGDAVIAAVRDGRIPRTEGHAVFLTRGPTAVPLLVARHLTMFGALPERVVSLFVRFEATARVPASERVTVQALGEGFWYVEVRFGFVEIPNLVMALEEARRQDCRIDADRAIFFAAHDDIVPKAQRPRMFGPQRLLFALQYRNAVRTPDRFALPRDRFFELGRQIEL